MSKRKFRKIVKKASIQQMLDYLHQMKSDQNKVKHLKYNELKLADFSQPKMHFSIHIAYFLAKLQTSMVKEVKCNFKTMHNTLICQSCLKHEYTQEHLLSCEKLIGSNELLIYIPQYYEIWEGSFEEKIISLS